jgi:glycosyltransferase involved in cell wall biosynthesis
LCFVQAGVMPESAAAIEQLRAYASLSGVGAVGGRINDGGGFTVTANGVRECFADQRGISYYFYREVARNVAAPCRGLLLTKRCDFESLGGFDADRYPVSLFEADYCLRLAGLGMRSVHVGDARFSLENQAGIDPCEQQTFRRAHGTIDRYSNPNFATAFEPGGDAVTVVTRPSQPLDVLVAAHNLNSPEGAPRYLSEIVLGLRSRGVLEASVVSPTGGAGAAVYHSGNIPVAILNGDWTPHLIDAQWSPRSYEACQNELRQMLKAKPPQAVLANTLLMFPWVEAAARLGIPCVWIIHESYSQQVLNRLFTPYAQARLAAAFAVATRIIPASHDTAALFRQWDVRHGIRVIHNGLDPAAIDSHCRTLSRAEACEKLGLDSTLFHAVAIGTVCERKGQHTLVEAAAMLSKTRNDFRVHLVGMRPGVPYAEYLQQLLIRRGTGDCVNLVQETNRAFDWYRAADTYVCTSHMETFSRSILEAEAFGLPIVSTPCEGIGEQVVWNQNALKFEKNDADTLACHLETLMNHRDLSRQMALKSRAVFELHNSYPQMLDEYQAVLQQACRAGSAPAVQLFRQAA